MLHEPVHLQSTAVVLYLYSESPAQSACDHAASISLDNLDGIYTSPECLPHQEASALTLEKNDAFPDLSVHQVIFPGPPDGLQPQETCTNLTKYGEIVL